MADLLTYDQRVKYLQDRGSLWGSTNFSDPRNLGVIKRPTANFIWDPSIRGAGRGSIRVGWASEKDPGDAGGIAHMFFPPQGTGGRVCVQVQFQVNAEWIRLASDATGTATAGGGAMKIYSLDYHIPDPRDATVLKSCGESEFVITNDSRVGGPIGYHACGQYEHFAAWTPRIPPVGPTGQIALQQACSIAAPHGPGCIMWAPDTTMTMTLDLKVGTFYSTADYDNQAIRNDPARRDTHVYLTMQVGNGQPRVVHDIDIMLTKGSLVTPLPYEVLFVPFSFDYHRGSDFVHIWQVKTVDWWQEKYKADGISDEFLPGFTRREFLQPYSLAHIEALKRFPSALAYRQSWLETPTADAPVVMPRNMWGYAPPHLPAWCHYTSVIIGAEPIPPAVEEHFGADILPPIVTHEGPLVVTPKGAEFKVFAADALGAGIADVKLLVDGVPVGADPSGISPAKFRLSSAFVKVGAHEVKAQATDFVGLTDESPPTQVDVQGYPVRPFGVRPTAGTFKRLAGRMVDAVRDEYWKPGVGKADWGWPVSNILGGGGGAYLDPKRRMLVVPAAGSQSHGANDTYGLDLTVNPPTWKRVIDGSVPATVPKITAPAPFATETYSDGKPVGRAVNGGACYLPIVDRGFTYGGSRYRGGQLTSGWILNVEDQAGGYETTIPSVNENGINLSMAEWPMTGEAVFWTTNMIIAFDALKFRFRMLHRIQRAGIHDVITIVGNELLCIGNGKARIVNLSTGAIQDLSGPLAQFATMGTCGMQWHPPSGSVLIWPGSGAVIHAVQWGTWAVTSRTLTGDVPTPSVGGTWGRFAVDPTDPSGIGVILSDHSVTTLFNLALSDAPPPPPPNEKTFRIVKGPFVEVS